jgi:hypothetical protein
MNFGRFCFLDTPEISGESANLRIGLRMKMKTENTKLF